MNQEARMARVSFAEVTKRYYGGQEAVADLNPEIADGELPVLVGPSGSGKSTALRMIAGQEEISAGEPVRFTHNERTAPEWWQSSPSSTSARATSSIASCPTTRPPPRRPGRTGHCTVHRRMRPWSDWTRVLASDVHERSRIDEDRGRRSLTGMPEIRNAPSPGIPRGPVGLLEGAA
jgi:energy-coupling factor transporter ATP-binding protein EcfA2